MKHYSLLVEFPSIGSGYKLIDGLGKILAPPTLVEASLHSHRGLWGLYTFDKGTEISTKKFLEEKSVEHIIWETEKLPIFDALFGLVPQKLNKNLAVVESSNLVSCIKTLLVLKEQMQFELLEVTVQGVNGKIVSFMTRTEDFIGSDFSGAKGSSFQIINNPCDDFRKFFNLEGEL